MHTSGDVVMGRNEKKNLLPIIIISLLGVILLVSVVLLWLEKGKRDIEEESKKEQVTTTTSMKTTTSLTANAVVSPDDKGYKQGYLSAFCKDGNTSFVFDSAKMVDDDEANSGFRIDNPVEEKEVYKINEETRYFIQPYMADRYGGIKTKDHPLEFWYGETDEITKDSFIKYAENPYSGLFYIKEENDVVTYIYEIYVP